MKRVLTILFLAVIIFLSTGLSYVKYQKNICAHHEEKEVEYFANELEQKLDIH